MKDDEESTAEEQREAEALARALAADHAAAAPPPAVLETAALLRYAHGESQLTPARQAAIADRVRPAVRPRRARWRWWVLGMAPLVGAAAVATLLVRAHAPRPAVVAPVARVGWPEPSAGLLAAQARAARGQPGAVGALDAEMRAYRRSLYAGLSNGKGR